MINSSPPQRSSDLRKGSPLPHPRLSAREQVPGRQWCVFPIAVAHRTERCVTLMGLDPSRAPSALVERQVVALGVAVIELARPADALLGILDHLAPLGDPAAGARRRRSEEHPSELQSIMRSSYAVFC